MTGAPLILIGGGGHAKMVSDLLQSRGLPLAAYVDPKPQAWLEEKNIRRMSEGELAALLPQGPPLAIGFVGLEPVSLQRRLEVMDDYRKKGAAFPPLVHACATVSPGAKVDDGAQIGPGAIVNAGAAIGRGAIVNSGAIVEHDAVIGEGAHLAPGSIALGGCRIGACAFAGSGAVVIQGGAVAPGMLVKALTVHR